MTEAIAATAVESRSALRFDIAAHPALRHALQGPLTPKFLATRNAEGIPNVVPLTSLCPAENVPDLLHFGNFLLRKSVCNLEGDCRVSVLVITEKLEGWVLGGSFEGFEREGPHADAQRRAELLRYNAYTGIRNAGLVRVRSVERAFRVSKASLVRDFVFARAAGLGWRVEGGIDLPRAALLELSRLAALKVIAWVDRAGYPRIAPALSLQPASNALVCWNDPAIGEGPPEGGPVAANVLTPQAISYQVKGTWEPRRTASMLVPHELYAGGPPLPGARIV